MTHAQLVLAAGRLYLWIDCYQAPGKKLPDDDNMIGRCKAYRDGVAQVLGIDDKRFRCFPFVHDEGQPGGQVVMRITGAPEAGTLQTYGDQHNAG